MATEKKTIELAAGVTMTLVYCPPGKFLMGSPKGEPGRSSDEIRHEVTLTKGFWMGETPVTQGQWKALTRGQTVFDLARKGLRETRRFWGPGGDYLLREIWHMKRDDDPELICGDIDDEVPVYFVSFIEADAFCEKLTRVARRQKLLPRGAAFRLPTEAEWEYACRAGTTTALYNGDIRILGKYNAPALDPIAWYAGNAGVGFKGNGFDRSGLRGCQYPPDVACARRVKGKLPNAWGLYDMLGNICEWCYDRWGFFDGDPATDPEGPDRVVDPVQCVTRGGSWWDAAADCRAASRSMDEPCFRSRIVGFRVAMTDPD